MGGLQRPGFSPDYIDGQYERMDLAFQLSDWIPTADGQAILRNNRPLLAYIAGKPAAFTSKDHNFRPGETVEKQIIVINNSRETVDVPIAAGRWHLPEGRRRRPEGDDRHRTAGAGSAPPGAALRAAPGRYELNCRGELQQWRSAEGQLHDRRDAEVQRPRPSVHVLLTLRVDVLHAERPYDQRPRRRARKIARL